MMVLEKKLYEKPKTKKDREVIFLLSDNAGRKFNIAILKSKPVLDLKDAVYLFPYMVSEERARKLYEEIYNRLKS